jgi:hypothetical protein
MSCPYSGAALLALSLQWPNCKEQRIALSQCYSGNLVVTCQFQPPLEVSLSLLMTHDPMYKSSPFADDILYILPCLFFVGIIISN